MENIKQQVDNCKTFEARKELIERCVENIKRMQKQLDEYDKAMDTSIDAIEAMQREVEKYNANAKIFNEFLNAIEKEKKDCEEIITLCLIANEKEEGDPIVMGPVLSCN
jgi:phage shock protein A